MDSTAFVNAIKMAVEKSAINEMAVLLEEGKFPVENIKSMSTFYHTLNEKDQLTVQSIIKESVQSAVFGFFCVLDGVRSIENGPGKGRLELWYKNDDKDKSVLLNDFEEEFLHDIYND